jgi:hypothetical protein
MNVVFARSDLPGYQYACHGWMGIPGAIPVDSSAEKKADTVLIMLTTSLNPDDEKRTLDDPRSFGIRA